MFLLAFELYVIVGLVLSAVLLGIPPKTLFNDERAKKMFIRSVFVTIFLWPLVLGFAVQKIAKKSFAI